MEPPVVDFGLLIPPARPFLNFEPDSFHNVDFTGFHDLEHFEKELQQAKDEISILKAQDQSRDGNSSPAQPIKKTSESRYWTNEERERFNKALKTFGNDFNAIAKFVGTRSSTQVRTHAQKYYAKMVRDYKRNGKPSSAAAKIPKSIVHNAGT